MESDPGIKGRSAAAGTGQCRKSSSCQVCRSNQDREGMGQGRCAWCCSEGCASTLDGRQLSAAGSARLASSAWSVNSSDSEFTQ